MAEGVSGEKNEANGASRLDLPHLTRRELLSHRAKLERTIARGRSTEAGTAPVSYTHLTLPTNDQV